TQNCILARPSGNAASNGAGAGSERSATRIVGAAGICQRAVEPRRTGTIRRSRPDCAATCHALEADMAGSPLDGRLTWTRQAHPRDVPPHPGHVRLAADRSDRDYRLQPARRRLQSFLLVATQNPIEREGTYPLLDAQADQIYVD